MDYATLKSRVLDLLNRSSASGKEAEFIERAEERLNRTRLYPREYEKVATVDIVKGDTEIPFPTDFRAMRIIAVQSYWALHPLGLGAIRHYQKREGVPKYYAVGGNRIELGPKASQDLTVEMTYHAKIPKLSDTNTTNWWTDNAADLITYAALSEAALWARDFELYQAAEARVEREVARLAGELARQRMGEVIPLSAGMVV